MNEPKGSEVGSAADKAEHALWRLLAQTDLLDRLTEEVGAEIAQAQIDVIERAKNFIAAMRSL